MSEEYAFSVRTRVAFSDTDAQGVVYYGRYNPYFDLARAEWLRSLGLLHRATGEQEFVMRANDVEYFAPARFDDEIEIHVRAHVGRTSMTFDFAAFEVSDRTLLVTAHQTLVLIDHATRRPIPIPDEYREPFGVG
jgi:acyl-CoA thioester hydrolase